jgi:hypothetical protein
VPELELTASLSGVPDATNVRRLDQSDAGRSHNRLRIATAEPPSAVPSMFSCTLARRFSPTYKQTDNSFHTMPRITSSSPRAKVGPYSAAFTRGSVGDTIDGRSREGRFLRRVEAELVAGVGGEPTFAQSLLIRRAARSMLQLELLDEKMASGDWTAHDARTQGGLNNAVRLALRELGLKAVARKPPTIGEYLAARKADRD